MNVVIKDSNNIKVTGSYGKEVESKWKIG
jgi:hypothetical protein